MKKLILIIILLILSAVPARAVEIEAPEVPETAQEYMQDDPDTFGEGLWYVAKQAIKHFQPSLAEAAHIAVTIIAVILLSSILRNFSGSSKYVVDLVATLCISTALISSANTMIRLGIDTVEQLCEYGKLLLPVMTAALAAQGGITASTSLYAGTAVFNTILSVGIAKLVVPLVYVYMVLSIGFSALGEDMLKTLRDFVKWLITWGIKIVLYVFTGYLSITGVVSGTTDAAALKATKLAMSSAVPVVGNIIADASETVLVSAGIVKNAAGIYGLLAIAAIWIGPFIKIGVQYLLLKIVAAVCATVGSKQTVGLVNDFASIMGLLVAMTGTVCLLLFVSTVCYLKGGS